jgi:hypothetical protein
MQISEAQYEAAGEFVELVATRLGSGRAVHAQTAIASIARLAGSLLLRSFNLQLQSAEPGDVVLSMEANEEGPQLISIMSMLLQHLGIELDYGKLGEVPRGDEPELSVVESLALLQEDAQQIAKDKGLTLKQAAQAAAMATAFVVHECSRNIGAEAGCKIATMGFIEGCKTVPPALNARSADS